MSQKIDLYTSKMKYGGYFDFPKTYDFAYYWLEEEDCEPIDEERYSEKQTGPDTKKLDIDWIAEKKFSDYFKFQFKISFQLIALKKVEITDPSGKKVKTNEGTCEVKIKGTLVKDAKNKFDQDSSWDKWMQKIYEKWIVPDRIEFLEGEIVKFCDDFLGAMKEYFDITGRR